MTGAELPDDAFMMAMHKRGHSPHVAVVECALLGDDAISRCRSTGHYRQRWAIWVNAATPANYHARL